MKWTSASDLRTQVQRWWERGELLRAIATSTTADSLPISDTISFPRRLTLKGPDSRELVDHFEEVRRWITDLTQTSQIRIEWRETNHRVLGAQRLPHTIWIDSAEQAYTWIGKRKEVLRFEALLALTQEQQPLLAPWVVRYPLRALQYADVWSPLLAVVGWCQQHPRPQIYLRQLDIAGVHSKFMESHRSILTELLDLALANDAIDARHTGIAAFAARYGFLAKPPRIRFRVLDESISVIPGIVRADFTLDAESFAQWEAPVKQIFITENEINFLSLPPLSDAIAIFGSGYGWEALSRAHWLRQCTLHYWGDIDTHGFAILDQLRMHFSQVQSLLMDRATLLAHESYWGKEPTPTTQDLQHLTTEEQTLYDDLRYHRLRPALRLEQELIAFHWVQLALEKCQPT